MLSIENDNTLTIGMRCERAAGDRHEGNSPQDVYYTVKATPFVPDDVVGHTGRSAVSIDCGRCKSEVREFCNAAFDSLIKLSTVLISGIHKAPVRCETITRRQAHLHVQINWRISDIAFSFIISLKGLPFGGILEPFIGP